VSSSTTEPVGVCALVVEDRGQLLLVECPYPVGKAADGEVVVVRNRKLRVGHICAYPVRGSGERPLRARGEAAVP
jgi:hypothetical protein